MYKVFIKPLIISLSLLALNSVALPEDRSQPISVQADSVVHSEKTGISTYSGNVILKQGSMQLTADSIEINSQQAELKAIGSPARFQQQPSADKSPIKGQAQEITYFKNKGVLSLKGDAYLEQDQTHMQSDSIVYNTLEQTLNAGSNTKVPGRVQVILPAQQTGIAP